MSRAAQNRQIITITDGSDTTQQESVAGPTVPSKVDAGLTVGSTDTSAQGLGLAGAGVLLLAAAGVTAARKRTGDVDA